MVTFYSGDAGVPVQVLNKRFLRKTFLLVVVPSVLNASFQLLVLLVAKLNFVLVFIINIQNTSRPMDPWKRVTAQQGPTQAATALLWNEVATKK